MRAPRVEPSGPVGAACKHGRDVRVLLPPDAVDPLLEPGTEPAVALVVPVDQRWRDLALAQPAARAEIGPSDSATVGAPYIHARTVAAGESDTTAQFVITLSAPSTNEVRVNFGFSRCW